MKDVLRHGELNIPHTELSRGLGYIGWYCSRHIVRRHHEGGRMAMLIVLASFHRLNLEWIGREWLSPPTMIQTSISQLSDEAGVETVGLLRLGMWVVVEEEKSCLVMVMEGSPSLEDLVGLLELLVPVSRDP